MKRNLILAVTLILLGAFFLANNLGWIDVSLFELVETWWPALLIVIGLNMLLSRDGPDTPPQG